MNSISNTVINNLELPRTLKYTAGHNTFQWGEDGIARNEKQSLKEFPCCLMSLDTPLQARRKALQYAKDVLNDIWEMHKADYIAHGKEKPSIGYHIIVNLIPDTPLQLPIVLFSVSNYRSGDEKYSKHQLLENREHETYIYEAHCYDAGGIMYAVNEPGNTKTYRALYDDAQDYIESLKNVS